MKKIAGENSTKGKSLKQGPVILQMEDFFIEEPREKKDLTLAELNHLFKIFLKSKGTKKKNISIINQFSLLFNDPAFSEWHNLTKLEQSKSLSDQVVFPQAYDELITELGAAAGDSQTISGVVKDAVQNAIDSFSHAAFLQRKFETRFPGVKVILFTDQIDEKMILAVVDNGYGAKITKPKKSYLGEEYGDDFSSRLVDWIIRRFVEKDASDIRRDIAYTGGQGMAMKKLRIELQLDVHVHFLASGAVFELRLAAGPQDLPS